MTNEDVAADDSGAKTTVVTTAAGKAACERMQKTGYFVDGQGAFRFAFCYALAKGYEAEEVKETGEGKGLTWSVTGLDPNQRLRNLVAEFGRPTPPETQREQYRMIEMIGNQGLMAIQARLKEGDLISDLMI
jgi:hypothetical protein